MLLRRTTCVLVALGSCALFAGSVARADFVGGIDHFNGSTKDAFTWEEHFSSPGEGSITQSNAIELLSPRDGAGVDYTTRGATVGVGGSMQVDLSVPATGETTALFLGTNSAGTSDTPLGDDHYLELTFSPSTREIIGWVGGVDGASSDGTFATVPSASTEVTRLRIERTSETTANFLAYDGSDNLLGIDPVSFSGVPDDLHVALYSYNADATFDNATLAGNFSVTSAALPEPGVGLALMGAAALGLRRRAARR